MQAFRNPEAALAAHAFVKAILFYGGVMFAVGFAFGSLRELAFIPLFGKRAGHWIEFPLMLAATATVARIAAGRLHEVSKKKLLQLGFAGTVLLLLIESGFALFVLRMPVKDYLSGFDVTQGALFPYGLLFMCLAPLLIHSLRARVS
jgi:hypothetical protein